MDEDPDDISFIFSGGFKPDLLSVDPVIFDFLLSSDVFCWSEDPMPPARILEDLDLDPVTPGRDPEGEEEGPVDDVPLLSLAILDMINRCSGKHKTTP